MEDLIMKTSEFGVLGVITFYLLTKIEVGKRLIQAKEMVEHGEWANWLESNFALSQDTATNFMNVAKRFGANSETSRNFKFSQLVSLLKLPPGEEEKFIAEKAAEGTPVEDMSVRKLNEEIRQRKQKFEDVQSDKTAEISRLEKIRDSLTDSLNQTRGTVDKLTIEKNLLESQLKEKSKPEVVTVEVEKEVMPEDYQSIKAANATLMSDLRDRQQLLTEATAKVQSLQEQLEKNNKALEKLKKANERLERKQYELTAEMPADTYKLFQADIQDGLADIANNSIDFIITDPPYPKEYISLYGVLSQVAARVLKEGGSLVCMCGQSYLPDVITELTKHLNYHWCMCYLTPGQTPQLWQKRTNTFWKPLIWLVKGEYKGDWIGNDVMESPANDKRFHEWGQSIGGMLDIVKRFTDPNQIILDPFVGGGTTGVTAVISGRKFIGSDIEESNLITTENRIKEAWQSVGNRKAGA